MGAAIGASAPAARLVAAAWHLLRTPVAVIDLRTLRIPTFGASMRGGSPFWLAVGAVPFLLPLLFQTVFGWSAVNPGASCCSSSSATSRSSR